MLHSVSDWQTRRGGRRPAELLDHAIGQVLGLQLPRSRSWNNARGSGRNPARGLVTSRAGPGPRPGPIWKQHQDLVLLVLVQALTLDLELLPQPQY